VTDGIIEIVILAMIAAFLGMRLYSVLGERAEEEEGISSRDSQPFDSLRDPNEGRARENAPAAPKLATPSSAPAAAASALEGSVPATERGIRAISAADSRFDLTAFLNGAKGAYEMVLEAFWKGDRETLKELCDDDVYDSFTAAIDAREAAGETLDNRLVRIEDTKIRSAELDGSMARIAVAFVADIAAVTRDKDGNVVAGSLNDAIESRDIWTFMRDVKAGDPHWLLDETDEG
jgi:predicted lipid-binding transport protein (Tim44 family)